MGLHSWYDYAKFGSFQSRVGLERQPFHGVKYGLWQYLDLAGSVAEI